MKQELCFLYQQKVTLKTCFVAWRLYIYRVTLKKALLQYHSSKKHKSLQGTSMSMHGVYCNCMETVTI